MVEQTRAEKDGAVLAIGHDAAVTGLLFQKCYDPLPVGVVALDLPIIGRRRAADDQAAVPSYLLHCERSSGQYLFGALVSAGESFGIGVDGFRQPGI